MDKDTIETISGAEQFQRTEALSDLARSIMPVPVERVEGPAKK